MQTSTMAIGILGVFLGVAISSVSLNAQHLLFLLFIFVLCLFVALAFVQNKKVVFYPALFIVCLLIGAFRVFIIQPPLLLPAGRLVIEGVVTDEPDVRENSTQYVLTLPRDGYANVLLILPRYPEFAYGDRLRVEGVMQYPKDFAEPSGRIFGYKKYLLTTKRVGMMMRFAKVNRISEGEGNIIQSKLFQIKREFLKHSAHLFEEPGQSLFAGMIFGGKQSLGSVWIDRFRAAGLIHIVVLSGYNMSIVASWCMSLFRRTGFYASLALSALAVLFFAGMSGGGATVVRAVAMTLIVLLAKLSGRVYSAGRALLLVAVGMVLITPGILLYDPSFQLSFIAAAGLIACSPVVENFLSHFISKGTVREIVTATVSTQITVLPLLLYLTGSFSVYALPANLLVLPFVPVVMLFGLIATVIDFAFTPIATLVAFVVQALLNWMLFVVEGIAALPYAVLVFDVMNIWILGVFYAVLIVLMHRYFHRQRLLV